MHNNQLFDLGQCKVQYKAAVSSRNLERYFTRVVRVHCSLHCLKCKKKKLIKRLSVFDKVFYFAVQKSLEPKMFILKLFQDKIYHRALINSILLQYTFGPS